MESSPYNALLQMAIEHGKQLERVLQLTENLEDRQDDMKHALDYLLKTINGNGDGRGGLKTWAAVHDNELVTIKKDIEEFKKQHTENHEWMQTAKAYFHDRKQMLFNWKHLLVFGIFQTVIFTFAGIAVEQVWTKVSGQKVNLSGQSYTGH
jgi:hypothetical protein